MKQNREVSNAGYALKKEDYRGKIKSKQSERKNNCEAQRRKSKQNETKLNTAKKAKGNSNEQKKN